MMKPDICDDCGKSSFVEYHGDFTCSYCGLIKYTHMTDERAEWRCYDVGDDYKKRAECTYEDEPQMWISDKKLWRAQQMAYASEGVPKGQRNKKEMKDKLLGGEVDQTTINLSLEWFGLLIDTIDTHNIRRLMCISSFAASCYLKRGLTMMHFERVFELPKYECLQALELVQHAWKNQPWYKIVLTCLTSQSEQMSRVIHQLSCLPQDENRLFNIIKSAKLVYTKIKPLKGISSIKSHTLYCCCIFIACKITGELVSKEALCAELGVHMNTLDKHEATIQRLLVTP
jgi:transcription initiation factor TFIIIB Brf1 subunit/transcription initiation factor TFIIB